MTDEQFEEHLKAVLPKRKITISKSKKYNRTYERMMRHCHENGLDMSPFIWDTIEKFLRYQEQK